MHLSKIEFHLSEIQFHLSGIGEVNDNSACHTSEVKMEAAVRKKDRLLVGYSSEILSETHDTPNIRIPPHTSRAFAHPQAHTSR